MGLIFGKNTEDLQDEESESRVREKELLFTSFQPKTFPVRIYDQKNKRLIDTKDAVSKMINEDRDLVVSFIKIENGEKSAILGSLGNWYELSKNEALDSTTGKESLVCKHPGVYTCSLKNHLSSAEGKKYIFLDMVEKDGILLDGPIRKHLMELIFEHSNIVIYGAYMRLDESVFADIAGGLPDKWHEQHSKQNKALLFCVYDWMEPTLHHYGIEGGKDYITQMMGKDVSTEGTSKTKVDTFFEKMDCILMPGKDSDVESSLDHEKYMEELSKYLENCLP